LGRVLNRQSAVVVPLRKDAVVELPEIFACLEMVVGLYGIIYLEMARFPERGWLLATVGLVGKILGPIGWLQLVWGRVCAAWPQSPKHRGQRVWLRAVLIPSAWLLSNIAHHSRGNCRCGQVAFRWDKRAMASCGNPSGSEARPGYGRP
jgi:hypothetical protein